MASSRFGIPLQVILACEYLNTIGGPKKASASSQPWLESGHVAHILAAQAGMPALGRPQEGYAPWPTWGRPLCATTNPTACAATAPPSPPTEPSAPLRWTPRNIHPPPPPHKPIRALKRLNLQHTPTTPRSRALCGVCSFRGQLRWTPCGQGASARQNICGLRNASSRLLMRSCELGSEASQRHSIWILWHSNTVCEL